MDSVSGSTCSPVFVFAEALPARRGPRPGLGSLVSRYVPLRQFARGHARDLSGFLAFHPVPLPGSQTPAGSAGPRPSRSCRCCPRTQHAEGPSTSMMSGLNPGLRYLLPTLHERRHHHPCKARFRLAGCAFTGRELNPLDRFERFQATSVLLSRTFLTQAGCMPNGWCTSSTLLPSRSVSHSDVSAR
jgi:hypothetical protein